MLEDGGSNLTETWISYLNTVPYHNPEDLDLDFHHLKHLRSRTKIVLVLFVLDIIDNNNPPCEPSMSVMSL